MSLDLIGLGVGMLRCVAGSAICFMATKARSNGGAPLPSFLQKDMDLIREKLDSMAQCKLSAAMQNARQGLALLDESFGDDHQQQRRLPTAETSTTDFCVRTTTMLNAMRGVPEDARRQFELAQQLAVEAFHDKRNVPAMLRVECLKLQLFCAMLIHYQSADRWLQMWSVILEEATKDKELVMAAAAAGAESGGVGSAAVNKMALAAFWRRSNVDVAQALHQLLAHLQCAIMAALWQPQVNAMGSVGRSRLLQCPRLYVGRTQEASTSAVRLDAPLVYPWRNDRLVVVLPGVSKLLSLYPTNKLLTVCYQPNASLNGRPLTLRILDVLTLSEEETAVLDADERVLDVAFDTNAFCLVLLSETDRGQTVSVYDLSLIKQTTTPVPSGVSLRQLVCDPRNGGRVTYSGLAVNDDVYYVKAPVDGETPSENAAGDGPDWLRYENVFKWMLADKPGSISVANVKPFNDLIVDAVHESGLQLLLFNQFTDVTYRLLDSRNLSPQDMERSLFESEILGEDSMAQIQQEYPLKMPLLRLRLFDKKTGDSGRVQKAMLQKLAVYDDDRLVHAKEKSLTMPIEKSFGVDRELPPPSSSSSSSSSSLIGAFVANDETSSLNIVEIILDRQSPSLNESEESLYNRYTVSNRFEMRISCEPVNDRYLGGVVSLDKFVFVAVTACKVKSVD